MRRTEEELFISGKWWICEVVQLMWFGFQMIPRTPNLLVSDLRQRQSNAECIIFRRASRPRGTRLTINMRLSEIRSIQFSVHQTSLLLLLLLLLLLKPTTPSPYFISTTDAEQWPQQHSWHTWRIDRMIEDVRRRSACDRCHSQKLRCPKRPGADICERCLKAKAPCAYSPFRQKKPNNSHSKDHIDPKASECRYRNLQNSVPPLDAFPEQAVPDEPHHQHDEYENMGECALLRQVENQY
jgi:hypothetical protein